MFKNSSKTRKPNNKKHTLYQLSTHISIGKKNFYQKRKKKKNTPSTLKHSSHSSKRKKSTPHVEITLSTQCKQKLLISWTSDKHKLFPVVFFKKTIPYIMFKNSSKTKKPNKKKAHALSIIYPHSYWKKKKNTSSTPKHSPCSSKKKKHSPCWNNTLHPPQTKTSQNLNFSQTQTLPCVYKSYYFHS